MSKSKSCSTQSFIDRGSLSCSYLRIASKRTGLFTQCSFCLLIYLFKFHWSWFINAFGARGKTNIYCWSLHLVPSLESSSPWLVASTSSKRLTSSERSRCASSPLFSHFIERGPWLDGADTSEFQLVHTNVIVLKPWFGSYCTILAKEIVKNFQRKRFCTCLKVFQVWIGHY